MLDISVLQMGDFYKVYSYDSNKHHNGKLLQFVENSKENPNDEIWIVEILDDDFNNLQRKNPFGKMQNLTAIRYVNIRDKINMENKNDNN